MVHDYCTVLIYIMHDFNIAHIKNLKLETTDLGERDYDFN